MIDPPRRARSADADGFDVRWRMTVAAVADGRDLDDRNFDERDRDHIANQDLQLATVGLGLGIEMWRRGARRAAEARRLGGGLPGLRTVRPQ
jgi:hypothetical protein